MGALRRPQRAVLALALAVVLGMFWSNSDGGGDPDAPRGDGVYRPVLARGDGHMTFLMLRSAVLDGDLDFDDDLARFGDPWNQQRTATGRKGIPHPFGPVVVWGPVMAVAHGVSKIANLMGADIPSHGYSLWHQRWVFMTSCLFAFLAVAIGVRLVRRMFDAGWAGTYGAVAVLFGTPLTYYATYMPSYGHAMDAFFCAAFLGYWALSYGQLRARRFVLLGLLLGVSAMIRAQDFGLGIALLFEVIFQVVDGPGDRGGTRARWALRWIGAGALTLAVALVAFSPQMLAWKIVYGEYLTSPNGPHYVRLGHPMVAELLFSSRNGWLAMTPIAYAGVVGLAFVPRRLRAITAGLAAAVVVQVWVNASVLDWWASASFGQRRMCSMTLVLVIGLAALIRACAIGARRLPRAARHGLALAVLGWFVTWNMVQVHRLRHGKVAWFEAGSACCKRMPKPMRAIAQPIYRVIGNPFALPASAAFAVRYGVNIRRWDRAVGSYVYLPPWDMYNDGSYRQTRTKWDIQGPGYNRYIIGGFWRSQKWERRGYRWTRSSRASVFVPLLLPEAHRFTLRLAPNGGGSGSVRVRVNGELVAERTLAPGWTDVVFDVAEASLEVGTNVLSVESEPSPYVADAFVPPPPEGAPALFPVPVGVAVGPLWVGFPKDEPPVDAPQPWKLR